VFLGIEVIMESLGASSRSPPNDKNDRSVSCYDDVSRRRNIPVTGKACGWDVSYQALDVVWEHVKTLAHHLLVLYGGW
jgi:hypothetical protein